MANEVLEYVVLDAGPIIRGHILQLFQRTQNIITIREVMEEVRDSKSRVLLEQLPYEIQEKEPSIEAMKTVVDFAKKSGNFAALSKTDLKLIALTLMLEKETTKIKFKIMESLEEQLQLPNPKNSKQPVTESNSTSKFSTRSIGFSYKDILQVKEVPVLVVECLESTDMIETDSSRIGASLSNAKEEEEEEEEWPALPSTKKAVAITSSAIDLNIQISESSNEDISCGDAVKSEENIWAKASTLMSERPEEWPTLQASCSVPYVSDDDHDSENDSDNHDYDYDDEEIDADREGCDEFEDGLCEDDNCVVTAVDNQEHDTNLTSAESLLEDMHIHEIDNNSTADSKSVARETSAAKVKAKASSSRSSAILRGGASGGWSAAASARAAAEDDGIGWISNDNITSHLSALGNSLGRASVVTDGSEKSKNKNRSKNTGRSGKGRAPEVVDKARVACMTTDFSMQNVLIQLGLKVLSVDGLLVKSVKQFVLRCMACYQVHFQMDRLFCSRCGAHHLSRVAASIDSSSPGSDQRPQLRLHLKKNYRPQLKGLQYSIPAPGKQDRYSGELLLREDQLLTGIWRQKSVRVRRDITSAFGEDVTSAVGLHLNKGQDIHVGLGSRNPNAVKGRERRGQKKKNGSGR